MTVNKQHPPPWPWRQPAEETAGLYPGLVVDDDRVSGSITVGRSRLPLWCFPGYLVRGGWAEVVATYPQVTEYGWDAEQCAAFLGNLLDVRGEFGRLLLVLADAERCDDAGRPHTAWWQRRRHRRRVREHLKRCLAALGDEGDEETHD